MSSLPPSLAAFGLRDNGSFGAFRARKTAPCTARFVKLDPQLFQEIVFLYRSAGASPLTPCPSRKYRSTSSSRTQRRHRSQFSYRLLPRVHHPSPSLQKLETLDAKTRSPPAAACASSRPGFRPQRCDEGFGRLAEGDRSCGEREWEREEGQGGEGCQASREWEWGEDCVWS